MSNDNKIDRRDFLKSSVGVVASCTCASSLAASLTSCESYTALETPSQGIEKKVNIDTDLTYPFPMTKSFFNTHNGAGAKITFPDVNYGIPLIIVRMDEKTFDCYSTLCPHDNCFGNDVAIPKGYYDDPKYQDNRLIICACHGSRFDPWQDGKAVTGPAEKPLKKFPTSFDKETNILTIKF